MDGQQYYAVVRRLGLRATGISHVYVNASGDVHYVPDPAEYSSEQREEIIEKLKERLGVRPTEDNR